MTNERLVRNAALPEPENVMDEGAEGRDVLIDFLDAALDRWVVREDGAVRVRVETIADELLAFLNPHDRLTEYQRGYINGRDEALADHDHSTQP